MQVIIITGASRGLGRELALELDKIDFKLVLASRSLEDLRKLKKQLRTETLIVKADVSKPEDVKNLFEQAIKKFGKIDIVINNAGMNYKKPFYEYSEEEYDYLMAVNTKSFFLSCKFAHEYIKEGKIVIISSIAGLFSQKYYSVYSASKHALEGFVKGARKETNLKFSIFHPYRLDTDFGKNYKHKSPKHRLHPRLYAQYVAAKIKGNHLLASYYFIRNHLIWFFKITVPIA